MVLIQCEISIYICIINDFIDICNTYGKLCVMPDKVTCHFFETCTLAGEFV